MNSEEVWYESDTQRRCREQLTWVTYWVCWAAAAQKGRVGPGNLRLSKLTKEIQNESKHWQPVGWCEDSWHVKKTQSDIVYQLWTRNRGPTRLYIILPNGQKSFFTVSRSCLWKTLIYDWKMFNLTSYWPKFQHLFFYPPVFRRCFWHCNKEDRLSEEVIKLRPVTWASVGFFYKMYRNWSHNLL